MTARVEAYLESFFLQIKNNVTDAFEGSIFDICHCLFGLCAFSIFSVLFV